MIWDYGDDEEAQGAGISPAFIPIPLPPQTHSSWVNKMLWKRDHGTVLETNVGAQAQMVFMEQHKTISFFERQSKLVLPLEVARPFDVIEKITALVDGGRSVMPTFQHAIIEGRLNDQPILLQIWWSELGEINNTFTFDVFAPRSELEYLCEKIKVMFGHHQMALVKWWYEVGNRVDTRTIYLPPLKTKLYPELYPDILDPAQYLKDYLASDAPVLLLAGPPGTGKTTLLRHLICENKLSAHVIYDENLMKKDGIFHNFLFSEDDENDQIMVMEDADTILNSREHEANKLMSRFLNVSDGLVKLPNKKIVFTTNLTDFSRVDSALIRPGRCYDVLKTRELNLTEAQAAARAAGLPIPMEKREYTLADLFNRGQGGKARRVGFGG